MQDGNANSTIGRSESASSLHGQLTLSLVNSVRLPGETETTIVVCLENVGSHHALNVEAEVLETPFSEYRLESWRSPKRLVGRLSPRDKQILEFTVLPKDIKNPYIEVIILVSFEDKEGEKGLRFPVRVPIGLEKSECVQLRNPYIAGSPLDPRSSEDMFFGRREVIKYVLDNLLGRFQQNILVLHGERRIGKTSLLLQLRYQHLKPPFYPVFLDMQGLADVGTYLFLHRICKEIAQTLIEFGLCVEIPSRQAILEGGYGAFDEFLDGVESCLHGGHIVIMVDEFEELEKRVQNHKLDRDILFFIRSQMQHRRWLIFVFVGTHKLEELSKEYFSIFFNTALYRKITFLSKGETEALIQQPVASEITYEARAVNRIWDATVGHPYFVQLVCYHIINKLNTEARNVVDFLDVNKVIEKITHEGVPHLEYLWQQSAPQERAVLSGIAELQRTLPRLKHFPDVEIRREIETCGERLTLLQFSNAIESLMARDLLRHEQENSAYGITFELLARWIRENHPRIHE